MNQVNQMVVEMLSEIARERGIEKNFVVDSLREGLTQALHKKFPDVKEFNVEISESSGLIKLFVVKKVVENVEDEDNEISLEDAKEKKPTASIGSDINIEIPIERLGRNAIRGLRYYLTSKVKDAEKDIIFQEFNGRVGEIITGTITRFVRIGIYVNLGKAEGLLPYREQIPNEFYSQGSNIKALITEVVMTGRGPLIYLSRTRPEFLQRLFEFEVPEIFQGIVEIKGVVRQPGTRAKILVYSKNEKIDPVGSCVGMKGSRVQSIGRELSGERIDVISWSNEPSVLITRALSPASVVRVILNKEEKKAACIVPDDQISVAIGKEGQNVYLASRLTGWEIDVVSQSASYKEKLGEKQKEIKIKNLKTIPPKIIETLKKAKIKTADDIMKLGKEDLMKLKGIGEKTADKIYKAINEVLNIG